MAQMIQDSSLTFPFLILLLLRQRGSGEMDKFQQSPSVLPMNPSWSTSEGELAYFATFEHTIFQSCKILATDHDSERNIHQRSLEYACRVFVVYQSVACR